MRAPTSTRRSPGCSADRSGRRARTSIDRRANARLASRGNRKGRVTMLWAIYCVDGPDTAKARAENRPAHPEHLQANGAIIVLSGATQSDDGATATGSLFIVNVDKIGRAHV